jgi:hypothetical protein
MLSTGYPQGQKVVHSLSTAPKGLRQWKNKCKFLVVFQAAPVEKQVQILGCWTSRRAHYTVEKLYVSSVFSAAHSRWENSNLKNFFDFCIIVLLIERNGTWQQAIFSA